MVIPRRATLLQYLNTLRGIDRYTELEKKYVLAENKSLFDVLNYH